MPIIDCITHLLLITLHSELLPYRRYPIWFTDVGYRYLQQILFLFYQPSVEAISCVQKCKKHLKI